MNERLENLERLGRLRDTGVLSVEEFEREKSRIISSSLSATPQRSVKSRLAFGVFLVAAAIGIGFALTPTIPVKSEKPVIKKHTPIATPKPSLAAPVDAATELASEPVIPPPNPWVGEYNGSFEGDAKGSVSITLRPNKKLAISVGIGSPSCAGGIEATVRVPQGNTLTLKKPVDDSGNACSLTLNRRGNRLSVVEDRCMSYHGFSCSFSGSLSK